ncbi:hypothetical protein SADUNF_Sadunf08G0174200 [Salix dunnii]|uniref:Uncharacterized protein n=1 Tax=Salix dunnii TaxID=1413687 RepID=A0A835JV70_9ROSI|nr:hypothetical protein SADUNF_Sadunf08G0174200 [Salix dunnii]
MELNVAIIVFLILFYVGVIADYSIHNSSLAVKANRFGLLEDTTGIPDDDRYSLPPDLNQRLMVVIYDDPEPQPASPPQPTPDSLPSRSNKRQRHRRAQQVSVPRPPPSPSPQDDEKGQFLPLPLLILVTIVLVLFISFLASSY